MIGPLFFDTTVAGEVYRDLIKQLIALLDVNERECWFQQDGATAHTANEIMVMLQECFGDRLISKNVWPPCPQILLL